jgi:uncharacterized membrane protein HdeD (DUF308 family)
MNELTVTADVLRAVVRRTWWIPLVQLGFMLLASPMMSAVALVQVVAVLAIAGGIAGIVNAFRLRNVLA